MTDFEVWPRSRRSSALGDDPASPRSRRHLASLQLAVPDTDGNLVYAGDCGTGFTQAVRDQLIELLDSCARADPPVLTAAMRSQR